MSELVFGDLIAYVDGLPARKAQLAERISHLVADPLWWPTRARLRASRGVDTVTACQSISSSGLTGSALNAPPRWGASLGLTPSLNQSGESSPQGSITKTGSGLARRLLVEPAWHHGRTPRVGATLTNRQLGQPEQCCRSPTAPNILCTSAPTDEGARQARQRDRGRDRA